MFQAVLLTRVYLSQKSSEWLTFNKNSKYSQSQVYSTLKLCCSQAKVWPQHSPFFLGPFFWESSSPFFSSPESSDLAFRFSLLSSMISLFSFDSFLVIVVVFLGPWRENSMKKIDLGKFHQRVIQKREDARNFSG